MCLHLLILPRVGITIDCKSLRHAWEEIGKIFGWEETLAAQRNANRQFIATGKPRLATFRIPTIIAKLLPSSDCHLCTLV